MLNWIITFFMLAVATSIFGFSGVLGDFGDIVQGLAGFFMLMLFGSLAYTMITGRDYQRHDTRWVKQ